MIYRVKKTDSPINTTIQLPASKSISNRMLILNALSYSPYDIGNLSDSDDTQVMTEALNSNKCDFDIKAAGTAMRFLTAFLSRIAGKWTITGTGRMKNRPVKLLVDALNSIGARIEYMEKEGYPPLRIYGSALQGGEITLSGGVSSQYISALLMVAPLMEKGLTIRLEGSIISRPYIHLTIQLMKQFGVDTQWEGQIIRIAPQEYRPVPFLVESDWSAASYWYAIAALSSSYEIQLTGLFKDSLQGDSACAGLFEQLGVGTHYNEQGVLLKTNGNSCKKLVYDFVNEPDLAPTFVVACCLRNIPFRFSGLQTLKIKETDRIIALQTELKKLGYVIRDSQNSIMEWNGERCEPENEPVISTYEDHRMAMAFAPAVVKLNRGLQIAEPGVVNKSYPGFWKDLQSAGFIIEEVTIS